MKRQPPSIPYNKPFKVRGHKSKRHAIYPPTPPNNIENIKRPIYLSASYDNQPIEKKYNTVNKKINRLKRRPSPPISTANNRLETGIPENGPQNADNVFLEFHVGMSRFLL